MSERAFRDVDIDSDLFVGLENLNVLDLCQSQFRSFGMESSCFKSLANLEIMKLNRVVAVKSFAVEVVFKLTGIEEIERGAFDAFSKLTHLDLTHNNLEKLRSGMFRGLDNLQCSSKLVDIEPGAFLGLSNLRKLDFIGVSSIKKSNIKCFLAISQIAEIRFEQMRY